MQRYSLPKCFYKGRKKKLKPGKAHRQEIGRAMMKPGKKHAPPQSGTIFLQLVKTML